MHFWNLGKANGGCYLVESGLAWQWLLHLTPEDRSFSAKTLFVYVIESRPAEGEQLRSVLEEIWGR